MPSNVPEIGAYSSAQVELEFRHVGNRIAGPAQGWIQRILIRGGAFHEVRILVGAGKSGRQILDGMSRELEFHALDTRRTRIALVNECAVGGGFLNLNVVPTNK